jgi:RNA polymerase sigma-70 factor (ECF subfamily)
MDRAQSLWPELKTSGSEDFANHVQGLAVGPDDLELHGHELYLAFACARGDDAALRVLEREYLAQTGRAVGRVNSAPEFVDEVHQALRERLLVGSQPKIAQYAATGSLGAWLRVSALRVALNHQKTNRGRQELLVEAMVEPSSSPASDPEPYRGAIQEALLSAFGTLDVRQRNVLRLHYIEGLNIDQIGALYGAHRATAARWLGRAREQIFDHVAEQVQRKLGLSPSEFRGVLVDVRSKLEISVVRLLGVDQEHESRAGDD